MPRKSTTDTDTKKTTAAKRSTKSATTTKSTKKTTTTKKTAATKPSTASTKKTTTATKKAPAAKKTTAKSKDVKTSTQTKKAATEKTVKAKTQPKSTATAKKAPSPTTAKQTKERIVTDTVMLEAQQRLPAKPIVYGDVVIEPYDLSGQEEYMNHAQKEHFIAILHAWKKALMEEVDRTMHLMQVEVKNLPDMTDRASQDEEFSVALRTRDRERKLIKKIEQTLTRIHKDDYGFCDSCGVEIGIRRLEARPTANLCIDCKTLDEIVERQTKA